MLLIIYTQLFGFQLLILFCSDFFVCTQLYNFKHSYLILIIFKRLCFTHRLDPNMCYHSKWTWELWQWRGTPNSLAFQNITIKSSLKSRPKSPRFLVGGSYPSSRGYRKGFLNPANRPCMSEEDYILMKRNKTISQKTYVRVWRGRLYDIKHTCVSTGFKRVKDFDTKQRIFIEMKSKYCYFFFH